MDPAGGSEHETQAVGLSRYKLLVNRYWLLQDKADTNEGGRTSEERVSNNV